MSEQDPQPAIASPVHRDQPWMGLDSFTEDTREWFYGRDEEVAELSRRIQRKTLTVLFGQSGLGKTSMINAGVVPLLRAQGYCPVYVRISYVEGAPPAAEQIKQAILRATTSVGVWSNAGAAKPGESLWEFLHHRDEHLIDAAGRTLIPFLIFDQFEEVFTLAQADDAGKQRTAHFVSELADLAESRPSQALEAQIDEDASLTEQFDFARNDYRILLALREDYLAHLENLRTVMPSVTQNHMRLARMSGVQALNAVRKPGGHLVSEEVAIEIVRFVAGGAELAHAEVEPSLLSLVCRELNNNRIALNRSEISTELLAGSHASILSEFYQRAMSGMPDGVHVVIEDQLLTEGGYRENLAEERMLGALALAGAPPDALATLVNRRLLRIEERLDVRRVELTHDVLCGVVKAAREQRHERLAKELAQAQLMEKEREQFRTRRQLVRARQTAAACLVLALAAGGACWAAFDSKQKAKQTRGEAEKLVGYLLDEFYEELRPSGRVDLVNELGRRSVAYYDALPKNVSDAETERNRGMALFRFGAVQSQLGERERAAALLEAASVKLEQTYERDDHQETDRINLADAIRIRAGVVAQNDAQAALTMLQRPHALLRPLAEAAGASVEVRRAYAEVLIQMGRCQQGIRKRDEALRTLEQARAVVAATPDFNENLAAQAVYVEASSWLFDALIRMDRSGPQAKEVLIQAMQAADQVMEQRPGHFQVLEAQSRMLGKQSEVALEGRWIKEAVEVLRADEAIKSKLLRVDKGTEDSWAGLSNARGHLIVPLWSQGHVTEALKAGESALAIYDKRQPRISQYRQLSLNALQLAAIYAEKGDQAIAMQMADRAQDYRARMYEGRAADDPERQRGLLRTEIARLDIERVLGKELTLDKSQAILDDVDKIGKRAAGPGAPDNSGLIRDARMLDAQIALQVRDYPRAAESAAKASEAGGRLQVFDVDRPATREIIRALALTNMDRKAEARDVLRGLIDAHVSLIEQDSDDQYVRVDLAAALVVSALAQSGMRTAELRKAEALLDGLPSEMHGLKTVQDWKARLEDARKGRH